MIKLIHNLFVDFFLFSQFLIDFNISYFIAIRSVRLRNDNWLWLGGLDHPRRLVECLRQERDVQRHDAVLITHRIELQMPRGGNCSVQLPTNGREYDDAYDFLR